jgi:iron complex outermembrane recepter protein
MRLLKGGYAGAPPWVGLTTTLLIGLACPSSLLFSSAGIGGQDVLELEAFVVENDQTGLTIPDQASIEALRNRTSGGVDLINQMDLKEMRLTGLRDLLEYSPGVFVQTSGPGMKVSIRGSGLSDPPHLRGLRMMQDGIPLSRITEGSGGDFGFVDPLTTSFTEVYRGANGLVYGASLSGGVINFASRTGHDSPGSRIRAEAGSFGFASGFASAGGAGERADGFGSATYRREDGYQQNSALDYIRVGGNVGWRWNEGFESRLYVTGIDYDSELPGNLTRTQWRENPRQANPGFLASGGASNRRLFRVAQKNVWVRPDYTGELSLFYVRDQQDHPLFGTYLESVAEDVGFTSRSTWGWEGRAGENTVTLGVLGATGTKQDERFENLGGMRGAPVQANESSGDLWEFFFLQGLALGRGLTVDYGGQFTYLQRQNDSTLPAVGEVFSRSYGHASPKLGLIWEAHPQAHFFANASRSYEPPNSAYLVDRQTGALRDISVQKADTVEIGAHGSREGWSWDLSLYQSWIEGGFLALSDADGFPLGIVNADRTIHRGIELGLVLPGGVAASTLRTTYTLNDFRFEDDEVFGNNRIGGVPRQVLRSEWRLTLGHGVFMAPNLEWVPSSYPVDQANTVEADGYLILGLRMGWTLRENIRFFGEVRNLGDRRYIAATGTALGDAGGGDVAAFRPGDGRAFYGGVDWTF